MHYYQVTNTGEAGFVTHEENEISYVNNFIQDIWVTENTDWAARVGATEITKEEDIWFSFSSQTRHSFLTYLYDLSTMIDRDTLGLDLKKMTFNKNGITLDGSVRSFDAVEELIKQLKNTNLFTQVPNLQKTEL